MTRMVALVALCACGHVRFDATGDASSDGAPRSFCASLSPQPLFCSDFADGTADAWNLGPYTLNGTYQIGIGAGPTPGSNALVVDTMTIPSGMESDARLAAMITTVPASHAHVEYDVIVDTTAQSEPVIGFLYFDNGAQIHGIEAVYTIPPTAGYFEESVTPSGGSTTYYSYNDPSFAAGAWHRFAFDLTLGANPVLVSYLDGAITSTTNLMVGTSGTMFLRFGIPYLAGPTAPWRARFTNVTVDAS